MTAEEKKLAKRQRTPACSLPMLKRTEKVEMTWCEGEGCYARIPETDLFCENCCKAETVSVPNNGQNKILVGF